MIKVGVIGAGPMGRNHIRNYLALDNIFEFVGIYDVKDEIAQNAVEMFNVKAFPTLESLLDEVDAVSVVVPSSLHKEVGLQVAKHHVNALIEKPLALNKADCEELVKAYKDNDLVLSVGHIERFNPVVEELINRIKNEKIIAIEAKRCGPYDSRISDTNVIMDLMIHDIDLVLNKINNSPVRKLKALGVHAKSNNRIDYINATIQHENGIISSLIASRITETKIRTINVHTNEGYYKADLLNKTLEVSKKAVLKENGDKLVEQTICEKQAMTNAEPLRVELTEFHKAILEHKSRVTGIDAMKAVEFANKIEEEAQDFLSIEV